MTEKLYLRPLGFLYGQDAVGAAADGRAQWLAGGPVAFSIAELIEPAAAGAKRVRADMSNLCASNDEQIRQCLSRVTEKRPALCGMSLDEPRLMGIVNVTPDSFSDGGCLADAADAMSHATKLAADGADIIDIGGESTRPGSDTVAIDEELARVLPIMKHARTIEVLTSIDTRKSEIMCEAAACGIDIINDVSALIYDAKSLDVAVEQNMPVILMHARGDPKVMQDDPVYDDVCLEVFDFLEKRITACEEVGIPRSNIVADPGIGFGKTVDHNLELLRSLALFHGLGVPILLGVSRKRFIGVLTQEVDPVKRVPGSISAALIGLSQGVQLLRVHDVAETRQAVTIWREATR